MELFSSLIQTIPVNRSVFGHNWALKHGTVPGNRERILEAGVNGLRRLPYRLLIALGKLISESSSSSTRHNGLAMLLHPVESLVELRSLIGVRRAAAPGARSKRRIVLIARCKRKVDTRLRVLNSNSIEAALQGARMVLLPNELVLIQ